MKWVTQKHPFGWGRSYTSNLIFPKHSQEDVPWTSGPDGGGAFSWWSSSFTLILSDVWTQRKLRPVSCSDLGSGPKLMENVPAVCFSVFHSIAKATAKILTTHFFFSIFDCFSIFGPQKKPSDFSENYNSGHLWQHSVLMSLAVSNNWKLSFSL